MTPDFRRVKEIEDHHRHRIKDMIDLQQLEERLSEELNTLCQEESEPSWWEKIWSMGKTIDIDAEREKYDQLLADFQLLSHKLELLETLTPIINMELQLLEKLRKSVKTDDLLEHLTELHFDIHSFQKEINIYKIGVYEIYKFGVAIIELNIEKLQLNQAPELNPLTEKYLELHNVNSALHVKREERLKKNLRRLDKEATGRYQAMQDIEKELNDRS